VTDIVVSKCETALAAGTVSVPVYPPSNGPSVSDEDAVVLVVSVPVELGAFVGAARTGGFIFARLEHDESANPRPPTIKSIDGRRDRIMDVRVSITGISMSTLPQPS
jgi:hypothetical protein